MNTALTVKKLVFSALLAAMSLTLYAVEGMIPPIVPIPGFRIGLAYFPILFTMYLGGQWKAYDTALILIVRVLLSALISGNLTALLFSFSGGALSFVAMAITHRFIKEPWGAFPAGIFSAVNYTGDPAQEQQGLNSVFATDSTIEIIKAENRKLQN